MKHVKNFLKNNDFRWGFIILSFYLLWMICWIIFIFFKSGLSFEYTPLTNIKWELLPPLTNHFLLGTDLYGRSLFAVISMGLVYSIFMSLTISLLAASFGIIIGYLSVVGPDFIKRICETFINVIFVFPSILIAILVMSIFGNSWWGLVGALVFTGWSGYARIARGEVKRILGLPYVEAAKAIGMRPVRLFFTVVLPGILPQLLIHIVIGLSGVIVSEASLGFLGLGGSSYSWGGLLAMGKTVLLEAPYLSISVSLVLSFLIIGLNLMGDGLRDILDPNSKE